MTHDQEHLHFTYFSHWNERELGPICFLLAFPASIASRRYRSNNNGAWQSQLFCFGFRQLTVVGANHYKVVWRLSSLARASRVMVDYTVAENVCPSILMLLCVLI